MRLVFMGSDAFAVPSLEALITAGHEVVLVVTQPPKPQGRGLHFASTEVQQAADALGVPVVAPDKIRTPEFEAVLRAVSPDAVIVIAYGRILPPNLLSIAPKGCVNLHPSLLPRHRGASPVEWAILSGDAETGLSLVLMDSHVDTGALLAQERIAIGPEETGGELKIRLALEGSEFLVRELAAWAAGTAVPAPQDPGAGTYAPRLAADQSRIDWTRSPVEVVNLVRALDPKPGAWTRFRDQVLKVWRAAVSDHAGVAPSAPGAIVAAPKGRGPLVWTGLGAEAGVVELAALQVAGKKVAPGPAFVAGYRPATGEVLG